MHNEVIILIAEDDEGHAGLIKMNLKRAGLINEILHFEDGQEILDFLFMKNKGRHRDVGKSYLLLLDIRMPKVDGIEVLSKIKADNELKKLPVIMVTTTDDPREVERCYLLGCSTYIKKPIDYENFVNAIKQLGLYIAIIEIPKIN